MMYFSHVLAFCIGGLTVRLVAHFYFSIALALRTEAERAEIARQIILRVVRGLNPATAPLVAFHLRSAAEIVRDVEGGKRADFEECATLAWKQLEIDEAIARETERKN